MKDWTPSALLHASGMYWESCAIHAAVHLDVFTPLSDGPMTVTELADRTGCVPQSLDRLLTALCAMGLLIRQGETCELPPFSRNHLCRGNPGYLGHIVEHHRHLMPGWSKLDESVRENLLKEIQEKETDDLSTIPLLQGAQVAVTGSNVKGVVLDASFRFRYASVTKG